MAGEPRPCREARLARDCGLRVGQSEPGAPHLLRRHPPCGRQVFDEGDGRGVIAGPELGEELLGLRAKVFEIRAGGQRLLHGSSMRFRLRSANRHARGTCVSVSNRSEGGLNPSRGPGASFTPARVYGETGDRTACQLPKDQLPTPKMSEVKVVTASTQLVTSHVALGVGGLWLAAAVDSVESITGLFASEVSFQEELTENA